MSFLMVVSFLTLESTSYSNVRIKRMFLSFSDRYLYEENEKFYPSFIPNDPKFRKFKRGWLPSRLWQNVRFPRRCWNGYQSDVILLLWSFHAEVCHWFDVWDELSIKMYHENQILKNCDPWENLLLWRLLENQVLSVILFIDFIEAFGQVL